MHTEHRQLAQAAHQEPSAMIKKKSGHLHLPFPHLQVGQSISAMKILCSSLQSPQFKPPT